MPAARVRNGIVVNYPEPYMRRRDPDCLVIGDDLPTDKPTFCQRFGREFGPVTVDIRSFGIRTPPCHKAHLSYGIIGIFYLLPPALAWLWRLVSPRGHNNPSIVEREEMASEGVGLLPSRWGDATTKETTRDPPPTRRPAAFPLPGWARAVGSHPGE